MVLSFLSIAWNGPTEGTVHLVTDAGLASTLPVSGVFESGPRLRLIGYVDLPDGGGGVVNVYLTDPVSEMDSIENTNFTVSYLEYDSEGVLRFAADRTTRTAGRVQVEPRYIVITIAARLTNGLHGAGYRHLRPFELKIDRKVAEPERRNTAGAEGDDVSLGVEFWFPDTTSESDQVEGSSDGPPWAEESFENEDDWENEFEESWSESDEYDEAFGSGCEGDDIGDDWGSDSSSSGCEGDSVASEPSCEGDALASGPGKRRRRGVIGRLVSHIPYLFIFLVVYALRRRRTGTV